MKIKKPAKIGLIVAGALVFWIITIALVVSPIAKWYIEKNSKELVGRVATMDKLSLNIFTGSVKIAGFDIKEQDEKASFITFDTLAVKVKLFDFLRNKVIIQKIHLTNLRLNLWQNDSIFSFDDIIKKFASNDTTPEPKDPNAKLWDVGIYDIQLRGGNVFYKDLAIGSKWDIKDLNLNIPGVYFSGKETNVGFRLAFTDGGVLASKVKYDIEKSTFDIHLDLERFTLDGVLPYLQQSMRMGSLKGLLETHLDIIGDMNHIMNLAVQGTVALTQLDLRDDKAALVLGAQKIFVDIASLDLENSEYILNEFSTQGLSTQFIMEKGGTNNFSSLFKSSGTQKKENGKSENIAENKTEEKLDTSTSEKQSKPMQLLIAKIDMQGTRIHVENKDMQVPFGYDVSELSVVAADFNLDKHNKVEVKGKIGTTGEAHILWNGNINDFSNLDLKISLQHLSMTDFTPYTLEYTAYPISKGILTVSSHNVVKNNKLKGVNGLNLYKCNVNPVQKDIKPVMKVPLRTALYILKDRNEEIKIDLPIEGNINSPEFSYKKIILKTLSNLLVKVALAPFDFLSKSMGFNAEEVKEIEFASVQDEFTPAQYDKFNQLANIVLAKPELVLNIKQYINYEQAARELSLLDLKKDYYLSENPEKLSNGMDASDLSAIAEIKDADAGLLNFANKKVQNDTLAKMDVYAKALAIYKPQVDTQMNALATKRNQLLSDYMLRLQVKPMNLLIETVPYNAISPYAGKNNYQTNISLQGEEPFVATEE